MDLPVKFPSETEVILEDVASFRASRREEQLQCFRGMVNAGELMLRNSPKADVARSSTPKSKSGSHNGTSGSSSLAMDTDRVLLSDELIAGRRFTLRVVRRPLDSVRADWRVGDVHARASQVHEGC